MEAAGTGEVLSNPVSEEDSPVRSAVWLAQEIGIQMPPIPRPMMETLDEIAPNRLFATDPALLDLDSPGSIAERLASDWPASGLAFGYVDRGLAGHWFYTLVGARLMLHLSLRLAANPEDGSLYGTGLVSAAHAALEDYLEHEANYAAATGTMAAGEETKRRVVSYSDAGGGPEEFHAAWSPATGLSPFVTKAEIFSEPDAAPLEVERIIFA